ncbi:KIR protein [Plasmodium coatneyi]|uniref:KIR protein n=1 Tax=Plasmodium coatneyi TaxID=208452 RepID=A0A1B1E6Q6_9APIC|nr:KIR protein [Plasmodium coatneyi]ANQ10630.1 KIR protein [Plasmodium coatneyi]
MEPAPPSLKPNIKNLPSKSKFYDKCSNPKNGCVSYSERPEGWDNILNGPLNRYEGLKTSGSMFMNAYCYACTLKKGNPSDNAPCYLFYYWLGDKFLQNPDCKDLEDLLNKIYGTLNSVLTESKCTIKYKDVSWDVFKERKTIFEFWYNQNDLRELLKDGVSKCKSEHKEHIENAFSAYFAVSAHCTATPNNDYCKQFWEPEKAGILAKLLKLQCESDTKLQIEKEANETCSQQKDQLRREKDHATQAASTAMDEAVRAAKTTSSLSSIFGTLTATAIPVLLYKYKPWSSWFSKHTSGNGARSNRRRRRSATGNIDAFTESTSTYDSTDTSTIDGTVRSAAEYTRPSTGGGRTRPSTREKEREANNSTSGHQNNISYGQM